MTALTRRRATYRDLELVPPHLVAELLDGELVTHPRPVPRHATAAGRLLHQLSGPFDDDLEGPGGWIFMPEPELHFGRAVLVPDIAGWRRETLPTLSDKPYIDVAPDWVCEILSPATEFHDRGVKRRIYAEAGVGHLWLLDPRTRLLEAFERIDGRWMLLGTCHHAEQVALAPFEAAPFAMASLFPFDPPPSDPSSEQG